MKSEIGAIFCSVVMPVHNGERFLREAIESVLNQTYTNFEFLIIENCSTDSSVDIIKSYDDSRIRIIVETNCGQVQAYNRGFKEAKGEYVFIHDQDDISHYERFAKQLKYVVENEIDICGSNITLINTDGDIIDLQQKCEKDAEIKNEFYYNASAIHNSAVLIRLNVLEKLDLWDINYFPIADSEFYYRAIHSNLKFGNIPLHLYYYRIHNSQITASPTKRGSILLSDLQLNYLQISKEKIILKDFYFIKSLIYYYSNSLIYSLIYMIISLINGKFGKKNIRYLIIIMLGGIPLKLFRKYNLIYTKIFISAKRSINILFRL